MQITIEKIECTNTGSFRWESFGQDMVWLVCSNIESIEMSSKEIYTTNSATPIWNTILFIKLIWCLVSITTLMKMIY